jgi:hypothetical protein
MTLKRTVFVLALAASAAALLGVPRLNASILITLTGTTHTKYSVGVSDGTTIDATQWVSTAVGPSPTGTTSTAALVKGGKDLTWRGGVVIGSIPRTYSWEEAHSFGGTGIRIESTGPATWERIRVHNVEDGMKAREIPEYSNTASFVVRDCYMTAIRDDSVEDDRFEPGRVENCLFDGVHTFISEQNENVGSSDPIGSSESDTIYIDHVYVRLYPTNDTTTETYKGGGKWFKWQGRGVENHKLRVSDSVFAVGETPRGGWSNLQIPSQVTWVGSGNFILWLGKPGAYQGPKPAGVTFLEGQAAGDKWIQVRNGWLTSHGLPAQSFAANYDPYLSPLEQIPGSGSPSPSPSPTPTSSPTASPSPTPTSSPTASPSPGPTPSPTTSPTPTPSPSPTQTPTGIVLTFSPAADATIQAAYPDTNYGGTGKVNADASPTQDFLMRFNVSGVAGRRVVQARLALACLNGSNSGGRFSSASSNWTESSVTWATAPPAGTQLATLGAVVSGLVYEVDVTPLVTGDGSFSVRVGSASSDGADYASRENSVLALRPVLLVVVA